MNTIAQIKENLGKPNLSVVKQYNENGEYTNWLKDWDDDNRVAIAIHQETLDFIKANPKSPVLFVRTQDKVSSVSGKEYKLHIICKAQVEATDVIAL